MKLIKNRIINGHVSLDTINEFEKVILSEKNTIPIKQSNKYINKLYYAIYKFCIKSTLPIISYLNFFRIGKRSNTNIVFTVLMGLDIKKCLPHFFSTYQQKSIYIFDAWPNAQNQIVQFLLLFNINFVFVSSSQAAKILQTKLKNSNIFWIPEGINVEEYNYLKYDDKNIDVIAIGRKYERYHELIVDYLKINSKIYLYENIKGQIIFPTREAFIQGLAKSKISICVPSNITHPERSGEISTMTIRYLQSMASKCLVLGFAPEEMIELFGYNPIIEIDMQKPKEQIQTLLNNFSEYIPLIEKNYQNVILHHSWLCRWEQIESIMRI